MCLNRGTTYLVGRNNGWIRVECIVIGARVDLLHVRIHTSVCVRIVAGWLGGILGEVDGPGGESSGTATVNGHLSDAYQLLVSVRITLISAPCTASRMTSRRDSPAWLHVATPFCQSCGYGAVS